MNRRQRRRRVLVATRPLERIAAGLDLTAQVARDTGHAADLFKMIEVRLQFAKRARIVLEGHAGRNEFFSVGSFDVCAQIEVFRRCTPELPVPVHAGAAHAIAEDEGTILPIRGGDVVRGVTYRDCFVGQRLPEITSDAVLELVADPWELKIGGRIAGRPAFERHYG